MINDSLLPPAEVGSSPAVVGYQKHSVGWGGRAVLNTAIRVNSPRVLLSKGRRVPMLLCVEVIQGACISAGRETSDALSRKVMFKFMFAQDALCKRSEW